MRGARRRQSGVRDVREFRCDLRQDAPAEYLLRVAAVEEDAADLRMGAEEFTEIVGLGGVVHDRAVEAAGPLRRGEHVPERDAVAPQYSRALGVARGRVEVEDRGHEFPECV